MSGRRLSRHWQTAVAVIARLLAAELAHVQAVVDALLRQQRLMGPPFDDAPLLDDQHLVGIAHRAQAVGDDKAGAPLEWWLKTRPGSRKRPAWFASIAGGSATFGKVISCLSPHASAAYSLFKRLVRICRCITAHGLCFSLYFGL